MLLTRLTQLCLGALLLMMIGPLGAQDDAWPLITFENFDEIEPLASIPHETEWGELFFISERDVAIVWGEQIAIWDVDRREQTRVLSPEIGSLSNARIARIGSRLVIGGEINGSGRIRTWNLESGGWVGPVIKLDTAPIALAVSPDQKTVAISFYDDENRATVELRDYPWGDLIRVVSVTQGPAPAETLAFVDDTHLLAAERGSGVRIYDLETDKEIFLYQDEEGIQSDSAFDEVTLSPSGQYLAWIRDEAFAEIWDWQEERKLPIDGGEEAEEVFAYWTMVFSPDEQFVMSFSQDETENSSLAAWNIKTSERVETQFVTQDEIRDIAFNPSGRSIAVLYQDRIELWGVPAAP